MIDIQTPLKQPIFISGLPKSGTSMFKTLLDSHPEIFMFPANEFELFYYSHHKSMMLGKLAYERDLNKLKELIITNEFITRLNNPESEALKSYKRDTINIPAFQEEVRAQNPKNYSELTALIYKAMAKNSSYFDGNIDQVRYASKCVLTNEFFPELLSWFPDLKFVEVLRNPYGHFNAVRNSARKGAKYEGEKITSKHKYPVLGEIIRCMNQSYYNMEKWKELYPNNFYVIVYDRILEDPEKELNKLSEFIGVKFDPSMLNPTVGGEKFGGNSWYVENYDKIDKRPLTHWKGKISPLEIRLVNHFFEEIIKKYGFEYLESNAPLWKKMGSSEDLRTYIGNRILFKAKGWFGYPSDEVQNFKKG